MSKIKLHFANLKMNSEEWIALALLLFGKEIKINNEIVYVKDRPIVFFCESCEAPFESIITPTYCPNCKASPGPSAITLTHKSVTKETFPFYTPDISDIKYKELKEKSPQYT